MANIIFELLNDVNKSGFLTLVANANDYENHKYVHEEVLLGGISEILPSDLVLETRYVQAIEYKEYTEVNGAKLYTIVSINDVISNIPALDVIPDDATVLEIVYETITVPVVSSGILVDSDLVIDVLVGRQSELSKDEYGLLVLEKEFTNYSRRVIGKNITLRADEDLIGFNIKVDFKAT